MICERCYATFAPIPEPICLICGRPQNPDAPCRDCADIQKNGGQWGFDAARAAGVFAGPLREGIHQLKYQSQELLGEPLGAHLANRCLIDGLLTPELQRDIEAVIPIPLHRSRERKRGFNQARLLALPLAAQAGLPLLTTSIRRVQKTPQQANASGDARRRNITKESFHVPDVKAVLGKGVLLVDDVYTTGTTLSACAAALKAAGAKKVIAVTLAAGG